jgi:hypothetical protein
MHASEITPEAAELANELYWGSTRSVNQIADDLDLSKGALYSIIELEKGGLGCPLCGDEVGHPNRTAKDRGHLECPTCDWNGSAGETGSYVDSAIASDDENPDAAVPARLPPPSVTATRMSTIAGGALLGAAVGLALVLWARRR